MACCLFVEELGSLPFLKWDNRILPKPITRWWLNAEFFDGREFVEISR